MRYEHGTGGSVIAGQEVIEVRVARRMLWVGADAFPVTNITRVSALSSTPARRAAVWAFARSVILLALVTAGGVAMYRDMPTAESAVGIAAAIIAAILVARLVSVLRDKTYYILLIETGGAAHHALASVDIAEVQDLVARITDAIDDPKASFAIRIENHIGQIGDTINVAGTGNRGKVVG
ncbi:DUF6232 family protein [Streptomyces sp. NPDC002082]|uniref:DUF6232 family protein n=1 Tax=Streptomyces sp. NPDC002082 TaxID=3154772 RepID=UPI0033335A60